MTKIYRQQLTKILLNMFEKELNVSVEDYADEIVFSLDEAFEKTTMPEEEKGLVLKRLLYMLSS
jgi:hypothetical protein